MDDKNLLLQYKNEHFGRFIPNRPQIFSDLKFGKNYIFPSSFLYTENNQKTNINSNYYVSYNLNPEIDIQSFYERKNYGNFSLSQPKHIPIIKNDEFKIKHKITSIEKIIYDLVCIFPQDIKVPGRLRIFKYFGFPEWFEPFTTPEDEIKNFIKNYKSKINRKY